MIQQVVVTEIDNILKNFTPLYLIKNILNPRGEVCFIITHTKTYFFRNRYTYVPSLNTPTPNFFFVCVLFNVS